MIIAVMSQKGGTGKTTVATNLAACYATQGREVMLVDADPQHSALDWKADRPSTLPQVHVGHCQARCRVTNSRKLTAD